MRGAVVAIVLCLAAAAYAAPAREMVLNLNRVETPDTAVDNDQPWLINPCLKDPYDKMPFCDSTLDLDKRVQDIISRLTLPEKITALGTTSGALPSVGLPAYNWWSEATHGISHVRAQAPTSEETNFALPITTAGSFNTTLWYKTGQQIATEARAFMNAGNAYSTYWAPVINLVRAPQWGRNIETPGEDPYLTGQYAINFVKGFQNHPDDPTHLLASACAKHYVANSMESSTVAGTSFTRHNFNAEVTMQDLVDSYLAPFQDAVEQGGVSSLMCSYNEVNGIPSCANDWMLTTGWAGWQFDGYITSDCDADADVYNTHHYTSTPEEAVAAVLHAGTDVDCTHFVPQYANSTLNKGLITMADIDLRLAFLFRMRMRLGHFDPPGPLQQIKPDVICSDYAKQLAREGTIQGSVLLKNTDKALPFDSSVKHVAVIGPNSNLSEAIATYYGGKEVCDGKFWNAVDAVAQYATVSTALGVPDVRSNDTSKIPAAVEMAKSADRVVLVVGQDGTIEHEGHDRDSLALSDGQQQLIAAVASAAAKPVVVVILTGGAVDVADLLSNSKVGAVIHAGQPSVTVLGVGDLIFGKAVPSGRMVQTIYPASFQNEVSIFDMNMRPGPSKWPAPSCARAPCPPATNPGRTHRFYTGKATIPFGFGLSYTTFSYKVVQAPRLVDLAPVRQLLAGATSPFVSRPQQALVEYAVNVTNTGSVDADDAVLGFLVPPGAGKDGVPLQSLFGFGRAHIKAGETVTVWLTATALDLTTVTRAGERVAWPGTYTVRFGVRETLELGMGYAEHTMEVRAL